MKKLFIALLLFSNTAYAEEVITGLKEETDLPVLNEELRKVHVTTDDLDDRITALESSTDTSVATQAQMEAATVNTVYVSPARTQNHPGVAKAWAVFDGSVAGTNPPTAGYNVTSITRNGTGDYTVTWDTDFSSGNYAVIAMCVQSGNNEIMDVYGSPAAGSARIFAQDLGTGLVDPTYVSVVAFGDQ